MRPLVAGRGKALQLGVTPEIARLADKGLAVDWSEEMIRDVWPGNNATHNALLGNWLALPLEAGYVATVYGDACLSVLSWPDEYLTTLQEVARMLQPHGRLVLRCFAGPDIVESVEAVAACALAGEGGPFGAFKLRFNMAAFGTNETEANTGDRIHGLFQEQFPDRARLSAATGWTAMEIDTMDAYAGSPSIHSYPTRRQIGQLLSARWRHYFLETAGYPLAERCPLLVADLNG